MNILSLLSVISLVLLGASSQKPKPCVAPPLMNGGFTMIDASGAYDSTGRMNYDAFGQRLRVRTFHMNANFTSSDLLMLFSQKVYYVIDWSRFTCTKRSLDTSFVPMQVPPNAQLMGQVFMGSSSSWGMGVLVNSWYGEQPGGMYSSVFTEIGCIPMTITSYTEVEGLNTLSTFNWVLGNTDPMDYVPPSFCAQAQLAPLAATEKADSFFTALKSLSKQTKVEN